ncbi:MAG: hypothetical protein ABR500_13105 [Dermatophilaceae bacterium]
MRWSSLPAAAGSFLAMAALSACGSATSEPQADGSAGGLVARGIVMQSSPDSRIELCIGPVATSYPPQCSGPELRGEFAWEDVQAQEQSGVRWSDVSYYATGTYDRQADAFTLTRPLSTEPPPGVEMPTAGEVDFPQLCDDPFRGGDPAFTEDMAAQEQLHQRLETLDGYVTAWVSDGRNLFNVIVTGDPDAAHASLREVWPGGLCVEQRDLPTAADVASAQAALSERADEIGLIGSGGGAEGLLDVEVIAADAETSALIHDIVGPWLSPDGVRISSAMVPLVSGG